MVQRVPVTINGKKKWERELEHLIKVERPSVIVAISEARAHGDLKENAEFHAAREQQAFLEGRIKDIEAKLSNCQVIDVSGLVNDGKVVFGSTVMLLNLDTEQTVIYQIVGVDEADMKENKISVTSPIARAMIGKYVDEIVSVEAPQGSLDYEIVKVEYM